MKYNGLFLVLVILLFSIEATAQNLEQIKSQRDSLKAIRKKQKNVLSGIDKSLDSLKKEIEIRSGWVVDGGAIVGLNFSRTSNWVGNPNPNAITSNLSIALNLSANINKRKSFWRNSTSGNLGWQSLEIDTQDGNQGGFLNDRTTDIFTLSSLYGYRIGKSLALSSLGDLNTAAFNFLNTGSLDLSTGLTWKPASVRNFTVVGHLISYHVAYSDNDNAEDNVDDSFGAKFKVSYAQKLPLGFRWTTNFNSFVPYSTPQENQSDLFEYTWINNLSLKLWKSFGIGFNVGIRKANFEIVNTQWFSTIGLSINS